MKNKIEELSNNSKMNGFQIFSAVIYVLLVIGSIVLALGTATTSNGTSAFTVGITYLILSSVFFFFMYSLGEIIKQLREINKKLNEEKK